MRTLLIGLGGSGGEVLSNLYERLTEEQRRNTKCIHLDMDNESNSRLEAQGIESVCISSSDSVRDVAEDLATDHEEGRDSVYSWLPCDDFERVFLASQTDDGASQNRYKSRLCLARFLRDSNNDLIRILESMNRPGAAITRKTLRVIIVSSIAGGTGSGTFIQVALYLRKFFRELGQPKIIITGLFACPDLFVRELDEEAGRKNKRQAMFANAYAAIRELNAMNLAVSGKCGVTSEYGKSIRIAINTPSEGELFDSKNPKFSDDYGTKPYDLMYFVDMANSEGGILQGVEQYYKTMADIAYVRLFSSLEGTIQARESNEMDNHARFPTAIYGSAGYSKIIYPYEDILRYLAERRTCEELDSKWTAFERSWNRYAKEKQDLAALRGMFWSAEEGERAEHYINAMTTELDKPNSKFRPLSGMIFDDEDGRDRASAYLDVVDKAIQSGNGFNGKVDAKYGLGAGKKVKEARKTLREYHSGSVAEGENALTKLQESANAISTSMATYVNALKNEIDIRAMFLAGAMMPDDAEAAKDATEDVNLRRGLLMLDNKDVHPLAARFLLYRVQQQMREYVAGCSEKPIEERLQALVDSLDLYFDEDANDGVDVTVDVAVETIGQRGRRRRKLEGEAAYLEYMEEFKGTMDKMMKEATNELKCQVYQRVLAKLKVLVGEYEGFFENLKHYRDDLNQKAENDLMRHEGEDDRCIFVGASRKMKEYYYTAQPSIRAAMESGSLEIYAAAGAGVYDALIKRTWKKLDQQDNTEYELQGDLFGKKNDYTGMGWVFDKVVELYMDYLRMRATYLHTTVIGALINECCREHDLDRTTINTDTAARQIFMDAFRDHFRDLTAKAKPMLRYSRDNDSKEMYYKGESNVSERYIYFAMGTRAAEDLALIFPTAGDKDALDAFKAQMKLADRPAASDEFHPHELMCFTAVHCLQPTQIYKFNEKNEGSYYHSYTSRLEEALDSYILSRTPHLDKRWYQRGAMPYISRAEELKWRRQLMNAFVFAMLENKINLTVDADGRECFKTGDDKFISWPEGRRVRPNQVSRLLEYLCTREDDIPDMEKEMKKIIEDQIEKISGNTDNLAVYKGAMTKNELLIALRKNLLRFGAISSEATAAHGKNAASTEDDGYISDAQAAKVDEIRMIVMQEKCDPEKEPDLDKTLGGLLELACLIHRSEENLNEDRNFGESLLACGAEIIDKFCRNMYGDYVIREDSAEYQEYVDLYNHTIQKMMGEYVVAVCRRRKLTKEQLEKTAVKRQSFRKEGPGSYPDLKIPESIRSTAEFKWLSENWVMK